MNADWVKSAAARRILVHWADPRPAWLWSADGNRLLWRNGAARFFNARIKKHGLRLSPEPVPIKGQVPRLVRLGSLGRSSLSRIQFLAGEKPISTTCTATPLELADHSNAVLIVGVDPVDPDILGLPETSAPDPLSSALFPPAKEHLLVAPDGKVIGGSPRGLERFASTIESQGLPEGDGAQMEIADEVVTFTRLKASPEGHQLLVIEGEQGEAPGGIAEVRAQDGLAALEPPAALAEPVAPLEEPLLPMGLPAVEPTEPSPAKDENWVEPYQPSERQSLSSLFDRLADHDSLYGELTAADEHFGPPPENVEPSPASPDEAPPPASDEAASETMEPAETSSEAPEEAAEPNSHAVASIIEFADDLDADRPTLYRVTGRGFTPAGDAAGDAVPAAHDEPEPEVDAMERTSRHNFDELSRILTDRVAFVPEAPVEPVKSFEPAEHFGPVEPVEIEPPIEPVRRPAFANEGALINIGAETFILNRLPLGIMVFRDQQVLFANRALTDLIGYETIEGLKAAGLTSIFPSDDPGSAGPVTQLVRRDGTQFPVTARLQSITWQGRPALMLSASPAEPRTSHEAAVRAFAEMVASVRDEGFVVADRAGVLMEITPAAKLTLGRRDEVLIGEPLATLVHPDDAAALRDFPERPARFAESPRPGIQLRGSLPATGIELFAEGQAAIVTGYFGFVHRRANPVSVERADDHADVDPSMLARISRGVRRPLNTIVGFSDLIRSNAFGTIENHRYLEYARDIKTAGQEIAVLVDELDDYARLRAGNYATRPAELDLGGLLESCIVRVRGQAGAARVLVRSAISERLPHIRADRASLGQAVLNLLASAIDQTPAGGSVILSAQLEEDGHLAVNIRDGGEPSADLGDRFVVFRDGVGKDGETLAPVRSSVGLSLTRALAAVNACSLSVSPAGSVGTLFSLTIPADLIASAQRA